LNPITRQYRGRIRYLEAGGKCTGREFFHVSVHADGSRTLRCVCEMDDVPLVRDVVYTVNERFEAVDCFVRVVGHGALIGSGWFRFTDEFAEAEVFTAAEGRVSQKVATPGRVKIFGSHPISLDIWKCAHTPAERPGEFQTLRNCFSSSLTPNGAGGPLLIAKTYDIAYQGLTTVSAPAGRYECLHYLWDTRSGRTLALYTVPGDWLPVKLVVPERGRIYELVEFEQLVAAAADSGSP